MKLLVIAPLLYHDRSDNGGGKICFELLRGLSARHEIALVAFCRLDAQDKQVALRALEPLCTSVTTVELPEPSGVRSLLWRVRQWLGGAPVEARVCDVPAMHRAVADAVETFRPELAMLQFPYMAQYLPDVRSTPAIMDVQDVFSVSRMREYAVQGPGLGRLKRMVSWLAWTRYEMRWYSQCALLMALSDVDKGMLHALVPGVPSFVNMPAIEPRDLSTLPDAIAHRVGFGGHFGHRPNLDALLWLSTEIAPKLVEICPEVEILVAGRGMPETVRRSLHPSIHALGFVEDYDGFVSSCTVFLAPLRHGGGVKIKILEALACGRPVVTTAIGAEGIALGAEDGLLCAEGADALAVLTATALRQAGLRDRAVLGASKVAALHGLAAAAQRFDDEVERVMQLRAPTLQPSSPGVSGVSEPRAMSLS